jgi:hypothetical protein
MAVRDAFHAATIRAAVKIRAAVEVAIAVTAHAEYASLAHLAVEILGARHAEPVSAKRRARAAVVVDVAGPAANSGRRVAHVVAGAAVASVALNAQHPAGIAIRAQIVALSVIRIGALHAVARGIAHEARSARILRVAAVAAGHAAIRPPGAQRVLTSPSAQAAIPRARGPHRVPSGPAVAALREKVDRPMAARSRRDDR